MSLCGASKRILGNLEADVLRSVSLPSQTPFKMWFLGENGTLCPVEKLNGRGMHTQCRGKYCQKPIVRMVMLVLSGYTR